MDNLFFKVWRNKYLNDYIFKILKRYLNYKYSKDIRDTKTFRSIENGQYLTNIKLNSVSPFVDGYQLPETITTLEIGHKMTTPIKSNFISNSITRLTLDCPQYNYRLDVGVIPTSITNLSFGFKCHKDFELDIGSIPNSVKILYLSQYNRPLKPKIIPVGVMDLTLLTYGFNIQFGDIPSSVLKFKFSNSQELIINEFNLLNLCRLEKLSISSQSGGIIPIEKIPQYSIKTIEYSFSNGNGYKIQLQNLFRMDFFQSPSLLTCLKFDGSISYFIPKNTLPISLKTLIIGNCCRIVLIDYGLSLLINLKHLELPYRDPIDSKMLPKSIEFLKLEGWNHSLSPFINNLPLLNHLCLDRFTNKLIITPSIKSLELQYESFTIIENNNNNNNINNSFQSILSLLIKGSYSHSTDKSKVLKPFNAPLLKSIEFDDNFNEKIPTNFIPQSVTSLKFGHKFNNRISLLNLPQSLKTLTLGRRFPKQYINNLYDTMPSLEIKFKN